jgi:hypothetical protein
MHSAYPNRERSAILVRMARAIKQAGAIMAAQCIFCGSGDMSREHVWPDWMKGVVPEIAAQGENYHFGSVFDPGSGAIQETARTMPNTLLETKVKRVCKTCNSGWMSEIENCAKARLTDLMLGRGTKLAPSDQEKIARWVALKVIMTEFIYPKTASLTQRDHREFCSTRMPLPNTTIWLAPLLVPGNRWANRTRHLTVGLYGPDENPERPRPNTHETTMGIKHLLVHVFGTTRPQLAGADWLWTEQSDALLRPSGMLRIWPLRPCDLEWDPAHTEFNNEDTVWELSQSIVGSILHRTAVQA